MTTNKELLAIREANTPRGVGTQTNVFADKALPLYRRVGALIPVWA